MLSKLKGIIVSVVGYRKGRREALFEITLSSQRDCKDASSCRSTFQGAAWKMTIFPLWRILSAVGRRRYRSLSIRNNWITSTGVGVLLETMEQNNNSITDLDLWSNQDIGNEGASLLAAASQASLFLIALLTMMGS
jgi:hypothetical protein